MYGMSGFSKKIKYLELLIFNGKLWTLYVQSVCISRKIEYPEMRTSTENYVHNIRTECLDMHRNWMSGTT